MNSTPFLAQLAHELQTLYNIESSKIWLILPSGRNAEYIRHYLQSDLAKGEYSWAPPMYTFTQFIHKLTNTHIPDKYTLLFELWQTYHPIQKEEKFEKFFSWGEYLLNDFEALDSNLVDVSKIFKDARNWLEMADLPFNEEESAEATFWKLFSDKPQAMRLKFLELWKNLEAIYNQYQIRLAGRNWAYNGKILKNICTEIKRETSDIWQKLDQLNYIYFIGFEFGSNGQFTLMKQISDYYLHQNQSKNGTRVKFWFDNDPYYNQMGTVDAQPTPKATDYPCYNTRRTHFHLPDHTPEIIKSNIIQSKAKDIYFIPCTGVIPQAKVTSSIIEDVLLDIDPQLKTSAIILPNEELLLPLLSALPAQVAKYNVSIAYPLKNTPLFTLLMGNYQMQTGSRKQKGDTYFYFQHVNEVLGHPLLKGIETSNLLYCLHEKKAIWISQRNITEWLPDLPKWLVAIFEDVNNTPQFCNYLKKRIEDLARYIEESGREYAFIEPEYLFHFYRILTRIEDAIEEYELVLPLYLFGRLFRKMTAETYAPFSGSTLEGLQINLFDDTKGIDYDHLIFLNANDGVFPSIPNLNSFIPYSLRKAYDLPLLNDLENEAKYYFYGMIRRASHIWFLYNNAGSKKNELSRYCLQIIHELAHINKEIIIHTQQVHIPMLRHSTQKIEVISKNQIHDQVVRAITQTPISYSLLTTLLTCPLQFYFRYVLKINEVKPIEEDIDNSQMGNLVHLIVEKLYAPLRFGVLKREVTTSDLNALIIQIPKVLDSVLQSELVNVENLSSGKPYLIQNIIKIIINCFIQIDLNRVEKTISKGFRILELEGTLTYPLDLNLQASDQVDTNHSPLIVNLQSRFDRLDLEDSIHHLFDYKTGSITKNSTISVQESVEALFEPRLKPQIQWTNYLFQGMYYSYLYLKSIQLNKKTDVELNINFGFYHWRTTEPGIQYIISDTPKNNNLVSAIPQNRFIEFEEQLIKLLKKVIEPGFVFQQTENHKACEYCSFNSICDRKSK